MRLRYAGPDVSTRAAHAVACGSMYSQIVAVVSSPSGANRIVRDPIRASFPHSNVTRSLKIRRPQLFRRDWGAKNAAEMAGIFAERDSLVQHEAE
ncbi:hypothetical protein [Rhizobacter sp. SG703]|uniref:hypothetical protein n=1 Tax=Rhizobacter sp. SG703 TaxID=2587140 RepID=UPI0014464641|nr:hypothetical protein [Rhizobacter sp. SG703]NKI93325.1 hypothetical protein [Rhizobacter sp. SG703]